METRRSTQKSMAPRLIRRGGVQLQYRGKDFNLAQWYPEYDWVTNNGYKNFGSWVG